MPANVLAKTTGLTHEEWLAERKKGIGSSDVAAICGLSPWRSPYAVYLEKTGDLPDTEPSEAMEWGIRLEAVVADAWAEKHGKKIKRKNAILQHPKYPFMLANIDRVVVGEGAILEVKTTSAFQRDAWADDKVPDHYVVQVQHQMYVGAYAEAYVVVLIGGQHLECRKIDRDDELIRHLIKIESEFWERVERREPPPIDGSESTSEVLKTLYPASEPEKSIVLPPTMYDLLKERQTAKQATKEAQARLDSIDNQIKAAMGDAEIAYLPGIEDPVATWKSYKQRKLDTTAIKEAGLYDRFAVEKSVRKFDFKEGVLNGG